MRTGKKATTFLFTLVPAITIIVISGHTYQYDCLKKKPEVNLLENQAERPQEQAKYQYIGAEKCASVCHNNEKMGFQYNIWKTTSHSNSYKALLTAKAKKYARKARINSTPRESQACLKCHSTGGELDTSYFTSAYSKEDGITCEACHKHEFLDKTYLPKEADCIKCHNSSVHKTGKFDFRKKSLEIAHPRPKIIRPE